MSNDVFKKLFDQYKGNRAYTGGVISSDERGKMMEDSTPFLTPTGRKQAGPEYQHLPGTRSGRFPETRKMETFVDVDFSEVEKRVMVMQPRQVGKQAAEDARNMAKKIAHAYGVPAHQMGKTRDRRIDPYREMWSAMIEASLRNAINDAIYPVLQDQIDEEGCGEFFNAVRYDHATR